MPSDDGNPEVKERPADDNLWVRKTQIEVYPTFPTGGLSMADQVAAKLARRSFAASGLSARRLASLGDRKLVASRQGAAAMKRRNKRRSAKPKTKLALPDLEQAKAAVVASLTSPGSQREYRRAIDGFVAWYCCEPRLSFSKAVVTRFRIHLEERHLAPATINLRLAAVRRLAYEAADSGLLSPELAAAIRRVKGARKLGVRLGNWLTPGEARALGQLPDPTTLRGARDRAMLAMLLGRGLRRRELADLDLVHMQRREEHWAIVDLIGKGGHIRTVQVPDSVKQEIHRWCSTAEISAGKILRSVCRAGTIWGDGSIACN